jgi:iron complex transport system substrate-binding protein
MASSGFRWAKTLSWETRDSVVHLTVSRPWKGAREALHYALVPQGRNVQPIPGEAVIRIPVRSAACLVTVHVGYMRALNAANSVVAVGDGRYVYDSLVRAGLQSGKVIQVGSGSQAEAEKLIAAHPDLILTNAIDEQEFASVQRLAGAGLPVLVTAEWMEDHPLARAEWVRLFGLLLGKEREADSLFKVIETSYLALAKQARDSASHGHRPTVLMGAPFRDAWFVPGGRSFMARFLADAGADYLWADDTTVGGVPLSLESVLSRARNADFWLHPSDWHSLDEGLKQDTRFREFAAFQNGNVYNNNAREAQRGFSDYWESGIVNPHRVLADYVSIFHGRGDSLFYYHRLPAVAP